MDELVVGGQIAGGIGLVLLALFVLTEGFKVAAAGKLSKILKSSTTPDWRGVLTGISVTAVVQSSSAVTVATLGFVNAGLMTLTPAVSVIFGTNIGTTITGWLVSFLGFEVKIAAFALPVIGLGMALWLVLRDKSYGGFALATAGFGLFFMGIDFLQAGFEAISQAINLHIVSDFGIIGIFLGAGIGFLMTTLSQSSSAAIALVLAAAQGGAIMLPTAAAMVVGANIGTSSTAIFATLGATANARRVAFAHVAFNIVTAFVAILVLLFSLPYADRLAGLAAPAILLALFHTSFNIAGTVLIWPLRGRLVAFLQSRFRTAEEDRKKPRYLDDTLVTTPTLAVQALLQEVARIDAQVVELVAGVLDEKEHATPRLKETKGAIWSLVRQVYDFGSKVQRAHMLPGVAAQLTAALRVAQYYREAAGLALQAKGVRSAIRGLGDSNAQRQSSRLVNRIAPTLIHVDLKSAHMVSNLLKKEAYKLKASYHTLRADLLEAVMQHDVPPAAVNELLESLSTLNRLVLRMAKARQLLNRLATDYQNHDTGHSPAPE